MFLIFLFLGHIHATEVCDDLSRASCGPGGGTDVTGVVKSTAEAERDAKAIARKVQADAEDRFRNVLSDPANEYFRRISTDAFADQNHNACADDPAGDACTRATATALAQLTAKRLLPTAFPRNRGTPGLEQLAYLTENSNFDEVTRATAETARASLIDPDVESKVKRIFPLVQSALAEVIAKSPIEDERKKLILSKLRGVHYQGASCGAASGWASPDRSLGISALLEVNADYDPTHNAFRYCAGMMDRSSSEFQIAVTIGHELSHSLDPCVIADGPGKIAFKYPHPTDDARSAAEYPLGHVLKCLRGSSSIDAHRFGHQPPPNAHPTEKSPDPEDAGALLRRMYQEGQQSQDGYKPDFCFGDQLVESFADWLGTEAAALYFERNTHFTPAQYRDGWANAWRIGCQIAGPTTETFRDAFPHPAMGVRIDAILNANPTVRRQMGCPEKNAKYVYCGINQTANDPKAEPVNTEPGKASR